MDMFDANQPAPASVNGCKQIYAPRGQAGEYAPLATNPYRGCGHGCVYCYVPRVLRMDRRDFDAGANLRPNYLEALTRDAARYKAAGITEQVMLSFTTDPYHPGDNSATRRTLEILIAHGLGACTLSKEGTQGPRAIALFRPSRAACA